MKSGKKEQTKQRLLTKIGLLMVALSCVVLGVIYYPVVLDELKYLLLPPEPNKEIVLDATPSKTYLVAADKQFSLVIPKIGVNVKILENVDPFESKVYQQVLTQGVAQAKGSAFPGEGKNTFLFAHSSDSFLNANRYNSVFYLLAKMESADLFYVVFNERIYKYTVVAKETVDQVATKLMGPDFGENTVVLMTCWPPGTTLKRLVVVGKLIE